MLQQHCTNQNLDKHRAFCTISAVCSVYNKYPFPVKFLLKSIQIYTTTYFFSYLCSVKPLLKPTNGQRRARHIYIKGVTVRFGFDNSWISQSSSVCQKQSNGNASWVLYIHYLLALVYYNVKIGVLYIHIRGAFSVARFDGQGNARAYELWNEWQDWLHVFYALMHRVFGCQIPKYNEHNARCGH